MRLIVFVLFWYLSWPSINVGIICKYVDTTYFRFINIDYIYCLYIYLFRLDLAYLLVVTISLFLTGSIWKFVFLVLKIIKVCYVYFKLFFEWSPLSRDVLCLKWLYEIPTWRSGQTTNTRLTGSKCPPQVHICHCLL